MLSPSWVRYSMSPSTPTLSSAQSNLLGLNVAYRSNTEFVLKVVQPALLGLMDGSVSTLAPLFAAAELTGSSQQAFVVGAAASIGAGISMGLSEAISDDGEVTGRGGAVVRGTITGLATFLGGMLHTLPFLIPDIQVALITASIIVVAELFTIAWIKWRYMRGSFGRTVVQVVVGGLVVFFTGLWMGQWGGFH